MYVSAALKGLSTLLRSPFIDTYKGLRLDYADTFRLLELRPAVEDSFMFSEIV